jgi:hypothetical protein
MVPHNAQVLEGGETLHHINAEQLQQLMQQQQQTGEGGQMTVVEMTLDVGNGQTSTLGIPVDPNNHPTVVSSEGGVVTTIAGLSAVDLLAQVDGNQILFAYYDIHYDIHYDINVIYDIRKLYDMLH